MVMCKVTARMCMRITNMIGTKIEGVGMGILTNRIQVIIELLEN